MFQTKIFRRGGLALALAAVCTVAVASVTFDPATGLGFVGKGDVQTAFSWNNADLQARASGITFTYSATDIYTAVCTFTTGEGTRGETTHNVPHTTSISVDSAINFDARTHHQIDGFILTGYGGTTTESGTIPVVGAPCPGNPGHDGVWSSVEVTGGEGGLYVNYGDLHVLIGG
jgi:hypothetical protein